MEENKRITPPGFPFQLLSWFCPAPLYEEIEGDLLQKFNKDVKVYHERKARRRLLWNVIRFFRPGIVLRNKITWSLLPLYMIANYLKIALRIMLRNKSYSLINVSGLALGMSSAILIGLWIGYEFSYDQFHQDKDRIYKAWNRNTLDGQLQCWDRTPRILAPTLAEEYSAVESAVSVVDYSAAYLFTVGNTRLMMNSGIFTDEGFLTMFSFPLLKGDASRALQEPSSLVITDKFAHQLFGDKEALGETVTISDAGYNFQFIVTGILQDLPGNTDFHFDYIIPFKFMEQLEGKQTDWQNNSVGTYVKLKKGTDPDLFNEQIKKITASHVKDEQTMEVFLFPLTKMRLYSRFENGVQAGGRIEIMRMMAILGVCLLAIACINFINLSTARAQRRSKEVGIRKVTGAFRYSLVAQFLSESVLMALGAGIISLGIVYTSLPAFNNLVKQGITLDFQNIAFWISAVVFVILVGILAGIYPALYLSSFNPIRVIKGASVSSGKNRLRKLLVVFQFGFAVSLIIAATVVYNQIVFVQHREVGYSKDNLVYHFITGDLDKNYSAYRRELLQSGYIESVTKTSSPITEGWSKTYALDWQGKDPESKLMVDRFYVDEDITKTAGITLMAGRDMDLERYPSDSTAVLLNEAAVKIMGFKQPVGELIRDGRTEWHVVGVIKDFVLTSPFQKVKPMVLQGSKGWFTVIHLRLNPHKPMQQSIDYISKLFTKYNPAYPFDYYFVDQEYQKKFSGTQGTLTITTLFTSIAIFIACLGLLGLSTYMIESRTKEIGIRKVMGSSTFGIIRLLNGEAIRPILWGIILFSPGVWFGMNWWLQSFEYRIAISPWIFIAGATLILGIAVLTISYQTYSAARANPVKSLHAE
ncbi:MAG TPA: ABC transporter permease [Ohtaekwangia sp.]|uniref:ABC transporter permease n=1 Tax=Ohtaekwangia sp. TaxID=2066019 RepID=UPI002F95C8F5